MKNFDIEQWECMYEGKILMQSLEIHNVFGIHNGLPGCQKPPWLKF